MYSKSRLFTKQTGLPTPNIYRVAKLTQFLSRYIPGQNGKYWRIDGDSIIADSTSPVDGFYLELREPTRICIR